MAIVIVENPSQSFIYPDDEIVEVILVSCIVQIQLFPYLSHEGGVVEEIIERVCDLFDVEIDIALKVLIPGGMKNIISSLSML